MVFCGWSTERDKAWCNAFLLCSFRCFATYWDSRGQQRGEANRLIEHRQAELISIAKANVFFEDLIDHVATIEESFTVHPLSAEVSVARMKRYLAEERHRLQLPDLIDRSVKEVLEETTSDAHDLGNHLEPVHLMRRVRAYISAIFIFTGLAVIGGSWMEDSHLVIWDPALDRLQSRPVPNITPYTTDLLPLHKLVCCYCMVWAWVLLPEDP